MKWKYIKGYSKYKIYKSGNVYENRKKIKPYIHPIIKKYCVSIKSDKNNYKYCRVVERLVYETFKHKIKDGTKIKYRDKNPNNYHLNNLKIVNKYKKVTPTKHIKLDKNKNWKPIRRYEEYYKISNYGDIYSIRFNRLLKPINSKGYMTIKLAKNKKKKKYFVHRLVYETFNDTIINKNKVIDHINRKRSDNFIENLREVSISENAKNINKINRNIYDTIIQYSVDNKFIKEWDSLNSIIEKYPNYNRSYISQCCCKSKKSAYGYVWRYKDHIYKQHNFHKIKTNTKNKYQKEIL